MKVKQFIGVILFVTMLGYLSYKFKESLPRSGEDWLFVALLIVIVLMLLLVIRRILKH